MPDSNPNSFEAFAAAVRESVDGHAKRKGYTKNDADGPNDLCEMAELLGVEPHHAIGEIVYKCKEYLINPREVLLVKIAGWAYILWRRSHGDFSHGKKFGKQGEAAAAL